MAILSPLQVPNSVMEGKKESGEEKKEEEEEEQKRGLE